MKGVSKMKDEARKKVDLIRELEELRQLINEHEQAEQQKKMFR